MWLVTTERTSKGKAQAHSIAVVLFPVKEQETYSTRIKIIKSRRLDSVNICQSLFMATLGVTESAVTMVENGLKKSVKSNKNTA